MDALSGLVHRQSVHSVNEPFGWGSVHVIAIGGCRGRVGSLWVCVARNSRPPRHRPVPFYSRNFFQPAWLCSVEAKDAYKSIYVNTWRVCRRVESWRLGSGTKIVLLCDALRKPGASALPRCFRTKNLQILTETLNCYGYSWIGFTE